MVTQHLADVWLNVHILEVLVCVRMVETQGRVQPDRHPHTIANPCQLPHLTLPTRVGVKGLLQSGKAARYYSRVTFLWTPRAKAEPKAKASNAKQTHLDLHALWLDDVDLVFVATPNLIVDHSHAADGVMRPAQVH